MTSLSGTQYARSGDISIAYQVVGDGPLDLVIGRLRTTEFMAGQIRVIDGGMGLEE